MNDKQNHQLNKSCSEWPSIHCCWDVGERKNTALNASVRLDDSMVSWHVFSFDSGPILDCRKNLCNCSSLFADKCRQWSRRRRRLVVVLLDFLIHFWVDLLLLNRFFRSNDLMAVAGRLVVVQDQTENRLLKRSHCWAELRLEQNRLFHNHTSLIHFWWRDYLKVLNKT